METFSTLLAPLRGESIGYRWIDLFVNSITDPMSKAFTGDRWVPHSPHKRIVIREVWSCHDVTMISHRLTFEGAAALQWRHNERDGVSPVSLMFAQAQVKKKVPRQWPLWEESTGRFPSQRASNAENVSISWRHHDACSFPCRDITAM